MHLNDVVVRMIFFNKKTLYVVICVIVSVHVKNVKICAFLNNNAKINCIIKKLTHEIILFVRQNIVISLIIAIENRTYFIKICDEIEINLKKQLLSFLFLLLNNLIII